MGTTDKENILKEHLMIYSVPQKMCVQKSVQYVLSHCICWCVNIAKNLSALLWNRNEYQWRKNTNLEFLFGFLRDATFRGEQGGRGGRDCYLWREFSDCGGDHQFGHVGRNSGPDATRVSLLWLVTFCKQSLTKKQILRLDSFIIILKMWKIQVENK